MCDMLKTTVWYVFYLIVYVFHLMVWNFIKVSKMIYDEVVYLLSLLKRSSKEKLKLKIWVFEIFLFLEI